MAILLAAALGVPEPELGRSFPCLLHPDRHPSATLWRKAEGEKVLYHDIHSGRPWLSLAQVRAALAGRVFASGPELAIWKLRLLVEAGLVEPRRFRVDEFPEDATSARTLAGFLFLVGTRWLVTPEAPAPFARRFASAWTGLSERELRTGFAELERRGLVVSAGPGPRSTPLWRPGRGVVPIAD